MKPLNDKQLKKLFSRKIAESKPLESGHLWEGIENSLPPQTSSSLLASTAKIVAIIGILSAVFFASNKANTDLEPTEEISSMKYELTNESKREIPEAILISEETNVMRQIESLASRDTPMTKKSTITTEPKTSSMPTPNYMVDPIVEKAKPIPTDKEEDEVINDSNNPLDLKFLTPISSDLQLAVTSVPVISPIELSEQNQSLHTRYWSVAPYLSYHTLAPSRIDENVVTGDPSQKPGFLDRVGVNIQYGHSKRIINRLSLNYSIGIDYYKTQFHFQVVNRRDPSATIQNNRLDIGGSIGFDYHHNGILGVGTLGLELGGRINFLDFSNGEFESYSNAISNFRLTYLIDLGLWKIGPTYSSFLTGRDFAGYGKINPTIYGFMFRRKIGGSN